MNKQESAMKNLFFLAVLWVVVVFTYLAPLCLYFLPVILGGVTTFYLLRTKRKVV